MQEFFSGRGGGQNLRNSRYKVAIFYLVMQKAPILENTD